jgi:hypothetical protein
MQHLRTRPRHPQRDGRGAGSASRRLLVGELHELRCPSGVGIGGVAVAAEPAPVRFFADGGSSGAEITLGAGPRREVIEVDWLTGRAALRREAP